MRGPMSRRIRTDYDQSRTEMDKLWSELARSRTDFGGIGQSSADTGQNWAGRSHVLIAERRPHHKDKAHQCTNTGRAEFRSACVFLPTHACCCGCCRTRGRSLHTPAPQTSPPPASRLPSSSLRTQSALSNPWSNLSSVRSRSILDPSSVHPRSKPGPSPHARLAVELDQGFVLRARGAAQPAAAADGATGNVRQRLEVVTAGHKVVQAATLRLRWVHLGGPAWRRPDSIAEVGERAGGWAGS